MDPVAIVENMSSYQAGEWEAATGLPANTMIPAGIAIVIGGIILTALPIFLL